MSRIVTNKIICEQLFRNNKQARVSLETQAYCPANPLFSLL